MPVVWNPEANAIFLQLLEQTPDQREALLQQCCGADSALAGHVRSLLAASERAGSFLESPPTIVANLADTASERVAEAPTLDFLSPRERPDALGRLGHYDILAVVGSGGFGVVLKAFDSQLHRVVAIKALNPSLAASATARRRFVREARTAAAINHENVVNTYAVEESGVVPYLVMEFVGGIALDDKLTTDGPLEVKEILRIGMQIAAGLAAAHKQGLVHRDVKPANILLENGVERVKITDFGLARTVDDVTLTQTGTIAGTPQYMSPEQARGEAVDHRSDLFSLGSVLYAMCAGRAPYRGETSLAVLKKVCDDTPHPLRDLNADIPDWLEEIIAKLHAHDKAERYQSAAEVADLLNQHLAELQQPTLASRRDPPPAKEKPRSNSPIRPWLVGAAAALVLLAVTLTITEAGGVTSLATTVVRIFTPMGTLIVETNDPGVKVTIQGDGGLKLTGAGLQEIRLPLGSYRVVADKDGRRLPLERELVSIAKGGREVVKVKLEATPASMDTSDAEVDAFVLLGGGSERKFSTLADAVIGSSEGDTIEIRGNGPFLTPPILIQQSLTIRAGKGFMPVIRLNPGAPRDDYLIESHGSLVLEGLEIREASKRRTQPALVGRSIIFSRGASILLANCRVFQEEPIHEDVGLVFAETDHPTDREAHPNVTLRNCQFRLRNGQVAGFGNEGPVRLLMENSVCLGGFVTYLNHSHGGNEAVQEYRRNTIVANIFAMVGFSAAPDAPRGDSKKKRVRFEASHNVIDLKWAMMDFQSLDAAKINWQEAIDAEAVLMPLVEWRERRNLFSTSATAIHWAPGLHDSRILAPAGLEGWLRRWNQTESESFEGMPRFHGGNLLAKSAVSPEKITAEDFRLRPDSAGYHDGDDGKDLGADVDLVGPGAAYERWKKTPEYQEWLKESGQQK
jgi:serine/threonine protein kinase